MDKAEGIHPRVRFNDGAKKNTCKQKNKDVTKRKIAAIEAHLEVHPNDRHSQSHVQALRGAL
jgi:ribosomal protein S15P/S13E